jgi:hypothetical protein
VEVTYLGGESYAVAARNTLGQAPDIAIELT